MSSTFQQHTVAPDTRLQCAVYLRSATNMPRSASSIESQLEICRDFGQSNGWEILPEHIYRDEAVSGSSTTNRLGLHALETAAVNRPRPFDAILIEETARLGRNLGDVLRFTDAMRKHDIRVCFVSQLLDSSDHRFPFFLEAYGMFKEIYVRRLRAKVFSAQKLLVMQGFHVGRVPYGYRAVPVRNTSDLAATGRATALGTKLEVAEEQAIVVRRIFHEYVEGRSVKTISRQLNLEKIASPRQLRAGRLDAGWSYGTIRRILSNPMARGEIVWNVSRRLSQPWDGKVKKGSNPLHEHVRAAADHLRIIDDKLWFKAAERLKQREGATRFAIP